MTGPDIDSLIAAARERHAAAERVQHGAFHMSERSPERCVTDDQLWPCPDRLLIDALTEERETQRTLLRDAIEIAQPVTFPMDHPRHPGPLTALSNEPQAWLAQLQKALFRVAIALMLLSVLFVVAVLLIQAVR